MKRLLLILTVLMLLMSSVAFAESDDEEVSLDILNPVVTAAPVEEEEPEEPVDPTQAVYEPDGTVMVTMTFAGDFTIGDNLQASGTSIFKKELNRQGGDPNFMFRNVKSILQQDDLTVINFEGTLTTEGRNPKKKNNDFLFRASPEYADILLRNGVEAVTLENNHVMDTGDQGLADTKANLVAAGVPYAAENEPCILYVKGIKVGILAYQTFGGRHDEIIGKLPAAISALREGGVQIVIVAYHWGAELDYEPNKNQIRLGRATVDAGADLVIGHHSHRINPIECYNGKYICYSLGNFSFAGNNKPSDMSSYLFQIRFRLSREGEISAEAVKIIPGRISSRTDYNDFAFTAYESGDTSRIQAVVTLLKNHGKNLKYALENYPLKWPDE